MFLVPIKTTADSNALVDLLNIGIDDFSISRLASYLQEMTAEELLNFCTQVVGVCDTITRNGHKLIFGLKPTPFLKMIEKNTNEFKSLICDHCKPLAAILTILESNGGRLLNVYPLVLQGNYIYAFRQENKVQGCRCDRSMVFQFVPTRK